MKKVLVLYAHPNPRDSNANRLIIEGLKGLENVQVHDLYQTYPYFHIDVKKEKELLLQSDLIVFQHPLYWYSMPALLKHWVDQVLDFGFALGPNGNFLNGKSFMLSITTGGGADTYKSTGKNKFEIENFFPPYLQTANVCGMKWLKPMVLHASIRSNEEEILLHAEKIRQRILDWCAGG